MKKFLITESERKHIKSLYATKGILNEGIPGLTSAFRIGMKQGLKDSSKAEIKKLLKSSFPNENIDDVYEKFEFEYLHARDADDVIEKYFKNVEDDEVKNFCKILAKEDPSKFAKYSLEAVSNPNTTIVIRYAVEHPEKYTLEQLNKIDKVYRDIVNNLDETDPFTSEVKNNLETQYGNKLKQHIELQFLEGMTWDNYGSVWEIDHITPINWYVNNQNKFNDKNNLCREANSLSNLKPLFFLDNRTKGSSY